MYKPWLGKSISLFTYDRNANPYFILPAQRLEKWAKDKKLSTNVPLDQLYIKNVYIYIYAFYKYTHTLHMWFIEKGLLVIYNF